MLNESESFVGASSTSWKENKALCSDGDGKDVELSYRRGCSGAISNLLVSFSRRAETVGGGHCSHQRLVGEQLDVPLSPGCWRLPGEEQLVETPVGGGPRTACPEGTCLTLVSQHSPRLGHRRDGDRYPRPLNSSLWTTQTCVKVMSSARMLIGSRGGEHVSDGGKQL